MLVYDLVLNVSSNNKQANTQKTKLYMLFVSETSYQYLLLCCAIYRCAIYIHDIYSYGLPTLMLTLTLCGAEMEYVADYKYLGCWVNEFGSDAKTVDALSAGAGRSFGRIINIFRKLGDIGIKTYSTLYESYVLPVANYASAVWGFKDHSAPRILQNKINRFHLGVHKYSPVCSTNLEMSLPNIRYL